MDAAPPSARASPGLALRPQLGPGPPAASRQATPYAPALKRKGTVIESLAWREERAGDDGYDGAAVTLLALATLAAAYLLAPRAWHPHS